LLLHWEEGKQSVGKFYTAAGGGWLASLLGYNLKLLCSVLPAT